MALATSNADDIKQTATQAADAAAEQVRAGSERVYDTAKAEAAEVYSAVKSQAEQAYSNAKSEAERMASERRDNVASYVSDISDALGSASDVLEERGRGAAAHIARMAADQIGAASKRVRGQDVGQVLNSIEGFARNRPAIFFACAFLASVALIRAVGRSPRPGDVGGTSE